jgi:hypothetical protein
MRRKGLEAVGAGYNISDAIVEVNRGSSTNFLLSITLFILDATINFKSASKIPILFSLVSILLFYHGLKTSTY